MVHNDYLNVSELNAYLSGVIDNDSLLWDILVKGELSGISIHKDNLYCNLKDKNSQIPMCYFKINRTFLPKEGDSVLVRGKISYYLKTGKLSFIANKMELCGSGEIHESFQELKIKLTNEGLFDSKHKLKPPILPLNICVITSKQGAVIKDIYQTIRKQNKHIDISVVDVSVQGASAIKEIINGIHIADQQNFDTIILARGGGSLEDLSAFNSEEVVRAIHNTKTFLISAIGHEVDYTLADAVADVRCLTPTAAGEFILSKYNEAVKNIYDNLHFAYNILNNKITSFKARITSAITELIHNGEIKFIKKENKLQQIITAVKVLNPNNLLNKGYFKIMKENQDISSAKDLAINDLITIFGRDGKLVASVLNVDLKGETNEFRR